MVISASGPAIGGVQIIDITTPSNPTAVSAAIAGPGNGYTQLDGTTSIDTITVDSRTYALVTSNYGSPNDPYNPTPVTDIIDDRDGFTTLSDATDIAITTIGSVNLCLGNIC